ncbi:MAG: hypothetical protein HONBIEJF_01167 [Fimbriimonadaceae bacterium]|nr:hypothetical protein [Fimbriimonadaceae bacterium]
MERRRPACNEIDLRSIKPHMKAAWAAMLLLIAATANAQVGRLFDSIEGLVASADLACLGRIVACDPSGKLRIDVTDDIRGVPAKTLELDLDLRHFGGSIEGFRDLRMEVFVTIGGTNPWYAGLPVRSVDGQARSGQFATIRSIGAVPKGNIKHDINYYLHEHGRIFDLRLDCVTGRRGILNRARAFQKQHPKPLPTISLILPNAYLRKVGDPNAYGAVTLPVCPETRATLLRLLKDPEFVLREVKRDAYAWERRHVLCMALRELEHFRDKETEAIAERFAREGDPKTNPKDDSLGSVDVRAEAQRLLDKWAGRNSEGSPR